MPEAERERFKHHIAQEVRFQTNPLERLSDDAPARALHIHLHDVNLASVPVVLFSSFIPDASGNPCHLVGIKVDEDMFAPVPSNPHVGESSGVQVSIPMRTNIGSDEVSEFAGTASCSSYFSTGSIEDIAFRFRLHDFTMNELPISDFTIAFAALLGPSAQKGLNLLDWLDGDTKLMFADFVLDEAMVFAGKQQGELGTSCQIELLPPHLKASKLAL